MKNVVSEINHQAAIDYLKEIISFKGCLEEEEDDFIKRTLRKKIEWREEKVREIMSGG